MVKNTIQYVRIPKRVFYPATALIIVGLLVYFLRPRHPLVEVAPVVRGRFEKVIFDEGYTHFKEKHVLSAPADGIVPGHNWQPGDRVKKGQVLIRYIWDRSIPLSSPVNGYVLTVFEQDRRRLAPGMPILEVGDPKQVEVIANLLSPEVVQIELGDPARILNWGGEPPLEGVVSKLEKAATEVTSPLGVKEKRVKVHIDITTDRKVWESIGDSYQVDVEIITAVHPHAALLPVGALFVKNGQPSVFRLGAGNKISRMPVKIGERNRDWVHVLGGIEPGEVVVLYPGDNLNSGQKIKRTD